MSAHRAWSSYKVSSALQIAAVLLLSTHSFTAVAFAGSGCLAEADCFSESCISPESAAAFPFTVDYTLSGDAQSTTFVWKVCSLPCSPTQASCQPLTSFNLRVADQILKNPEESFRILPKGIIQDTCGPLGPGLLLNGTDIEDLSTIDPSQEEGCEVFSTSLYSQESPLTLGNVCQQSIALVDQQGAAVFEQEEYGTSCMFVMELLDGTTGFGLVYEKDDRVDTSFQVDSLVETNETCSDFLRREGEARPNVAAYSKAMRAVVEGVARNLGDYRSSMVREVTSECKPGGQVFRHRIRTTLTAVVRDGLQSAYLTQLQIAVNSGALRESAGAMGASPEWLPTPMRYTGPYEGRDAVCIPAGSTGGGGLCGPAAWNPEFVEEVRY